MTTFKLLSSILMVESLKGVRIILLYMWLTLINTQSVPNYKLIDTQNWPLRRIILNILGKHARLGLQRG